MAHKIEFQNRAHEVSRLEAFSDVIFGFCISLIVVSLEAPKDYHEMLEVMRGFVPFAICFFLFIDIWFEHHHFFRRYALQDFTIVALNTVLLFVVLFYVYPLKFMFTMFAESVAGHRQSLPPGGYQLLFTIYGAGFATVFGILGFMYLHAYKLRDQLGLNAVEVIDTRESVWDNFSMASFGILSILIAWSPLAGLAGVIYFLIGIPKTVIPWVMGARRRKAEMAMTAGREAPSSS